MKLVPIGKQTMAIKTFGNENKDSVALKKYSFWGMNGVKKNYVRGFGVPLVCSPLSGQRIAFVNICENHVSLSSVIKFGW